MELGLDSGASQGELSHGRPETRDRVGRAAFALFAERGFDDVTADEAAAAAGVGRRTFFRYFPSKEDAVFFDHAARVQRFKATLEAAAETGAPAFDIARDAFLEIAKEYVEDKAIHKARNDIVEASPQLVAAELRRDKAWERILAAFFASYGTQKKFEAAVGAAVMIGAARAALNTWYESGCRRDLMRLARDAYAFIETSY